MPVGCRTARLECGHPGAFTYHAELLADEGGLTQPLAKWLSWRAGVGAPTLLVS